MQSLYFLIIFSIYTERQIIEKFLFKSISVIVPNWIHSSSIWVDTKAGFPYSIRFSLLTVSVCALIKIPWKFPDGKIHPLRVSTAPLFIRQNRSLKGYNMNIMCEMILDIQIRARAYIAMPNTQNEERGGYECGGN